MNLPPFLLRALAWVARKTYAIKAKMMRRSYFVVMRTTKANLEGHHTEMRIPIKAWDSWMALDLARAHVAKVAGESGFTMECYDIRRLD